ncbi:MAG: 23S rRNA (pseudouridine(1915)-N(3))-methyltransferase RlmH [Flavobacteriaceae bacterium]
MRIILLWVGKTDGKALQELVNEYQTRLQRYIKFEIVTIPGLKNTKNMTEAQQKQKEGEHILSKLQPNDFLVLLDERGTSYSSVSFSRFLQQRMNQGIKRLVFVVGGPYGFSERVHTKANGKVSLSHMTFSHQMIRPFITEQIYRAFTILRNEPYHHG